MNKTGFNRFICILLILLLTAVSAPAYADEESAVTSAGSETDEESAVTDAGSDTIDELPDTTDPDYNVEIIPGALAASVEKKQQVRLSWEEPTVNIIDSETSEICEDYTISYSIYRKCGSGRFVRVAATEDLSYIDRTIKAEKVYSYYVANEITFNEEVYTENSETKGNLFFVKNVSPVRKLKVKQKKNKAIARLSWNRAKNAQKYIIYRKKSNRGWKKIKTTAKNRYTDRNVKFSGKYRYKIKAVRKFRNRTSTSRFTKSKRIKIRKPVIFRLRVKNINQYRIGYSMGCEIVSLAIVMLYYAFSPKGAKAMVDTLYYKWTKKGNYDFNKAYYGNPHGHGSYGACYSAVIKKTANRFLKHKRSKRRAVALRHKKLSSLFDHLIKGRPVIVWVTEKMINSRNYRISAGVWNVNAHTLVLTGYNKKKKRVYVADPERGNVSYSMGKFYSRYALRGKHAVVIY